MYASSWFWVGSPVDQKPEHENGLSPRVVILLYSATLHSFTCKLCFFEFLFMEIALK